MNFNSAETTNVLTIVALVASIVSMILSCLVLWPQWKDRLAKLRDLVLWAALVVVAAYALNYPQRQRANDIPMGSSWTDPAPAEDRIESDEWETSFSDRTQWPLSPGAPRALPVRQYSRDDSNAFVGR